MSTRLNYLRFTLEIAALLVLIQIATVAAIQMMLPTLSPGLAMVLNAILLAVIACPTVLWRVQARARFKPQLHALIATPGRLSLASGAIVVMGVVASVLFAMELERTAVREAEARFESLCSRVIRTIERRFNDSRGVVQGARSLYAASDSVEREEFRAYVASQDLPNEATGQIGLGFIERISRGELVDFIDSARAEGMPDFDVWTDTSSQGVLSSEELFVVKYIEPGETNLPVWGFDAGSDAIRRSAIEQAVRTGGAVISRRIALMQDTQQRPGLLYLLPIYHGGVVPRTEQERIELLYGLVYAPVLVDVACEQTRILTDGMLDLEVFDSESCDLASLIFDTDDKPLSSLKDRATRSRMTRKTEIQMPGRTWVAIARSMPGFDASVNEWIAPVAGMVGTVLSVLTGVLFWVLGSARSRAESLARRMTLDHKAACDRAEQSLQDVRAFRLAVDSSAIVSEADAAGRIIDVNDEFCRISGYTREELRGRDHRIVSSGLHTKAFWVDVWRQIAAGRPWRGEVCNRAKNGTIYWVDSIIAPFTGANGRVERYVSIRIDITARKLAEQRLAESEERFRTLADSAPMMIWTSDADVNCTYVNRPWLEFTRRELNETQGDGWTANIHPDDRDRVVSAYRSAVIGRERFEMEYRYKRFDGSYRTILGRGTPRILGDGTFAGFVGACTDITELREAQHNAEAACRAKSAFLANMSHEIRTPLTAILGFADLLQEDPRDPVLREDRAGALETIRSAGTHLMAIVNDVLDLSKIEADRMTVEKVSTPIVSIIREVADILRPRAVGKGIAISVEFRTPVPESIRTDPTRVRQILMNLVGNAVKFTEAGVVALRVGVDGAGDTSGRFVIEVADTGPGMSADQASRLFESFSQADETVTRRHGGTGLGLVIAKRLAELLGGCVTLKETALERGSTFRLEIPLDVAANVVMVSTLRGAVQGPVNVGTNEAVSLHGRIILAEDGPDNQRLIAFHLRKAGAQVEVADNGRIALELIRTSERAGTPYDLLLTDMQMPEMDGYSLAAQLREQGHRIPIVALTAHAMTEDRQRCLKAGCDDYATKPIERAALVATCAKWLGATQTSRAAA